MLNGIEKYCEAHTPPAYFVERLRSTVTDFDWLDHPIYKNATIPEFIYILNVEKLYLSPVHFCVLVRCAMMSEL